MHYSALLRFLCIAFSCSAFAATKAGELPSKSPTLFDLYFEHSDAKRTNTDTIIFKYLSQEYPESDITTVPAGNINLLAYAAAGFASKTALPDGSSIAEHKWRAYYPPSKRVDGGNGTLIDLIKFGVFRYVWQDVEFLLYSVDGRDGTACYSSVQNQYLIGPRDVVDELIIAVGSYRASLHNEIWTFDQGYWSKNAGLWHAVQESSWDDVILDPEMKADLIENAQRFFNSREQYKRLRVPWKRGIIFHGPPGNGKTISIKATMHTLYNRSEPVPTLYVRTLSGYGEWALKLIFDKARSQAPCYLVFEDLDSLVTDNIRSYFLNQVDGLQVNDGILMVGSTNHLERLDPGISKRPSRFDRKFLFPDPSFEQRVQYCNYWRKKLEDNKELDFPKQLAPAVANITDGFSFAYIQEAFVASLLQIATEQADGVIMAAGEREQTLIVDGKPLEDLLLWRVIRKQIKILREELEAGVEVGKDDIPEISNDLGEWEQEEDWDRGSYREG